MTDKDPRNSSIGWNIVAGRQRPQFAGRGRGIPRPSSKRQRISTESGSSSIEASKFDSTPNDKLSIDVFKSQNIDDKLESIFVCLQDLMLTNQRLLKAEQTVHELRQTTYVNRQRIDILAYKSIDSEARQRRNNLLFWGIPEVVNEDCMVVLREFLADRLELDPQTIAIQRAHRIGKRTAPRRNTIGQSAHIKHRPLIAAFRDYQDVELVLSNAGKLRNTRFGINRDFPQEIIDARKPLFAEKKNLKSKYPSSNISIQYPAKLVKDGLIVKDMFPDWQKIMRMSRLNNGRLDNGSNMKGRVRSVAQSENENVFQSDSNSEWSDMEENDSGHDHVSEHEHVSEFERSGIMGTNAHTERSVESTNPFTPLEPLDEATGGELNSESNHNTDGNLSNTASSRPPDDA